MRIGLVTIFKSTNYGAVLQAYATKKAFSAYGYVQLIDYDNTYLKGTFKLLRFNFSIHGFKMLVHDILRLPFSLKLFYKFNKFINNELKPTNAYSQENLMQKKADDFDVYVCGSDQIWNPDIVNVKGDFDSIYFLSFASNDKKKISFASSIGHHHFTKEEKVLVKDLLKDFTSISSREADGKEKIAEILPNRTISHINDPTLLLSKKDWLETFNVSLNNEAEPYILVYSVPHSDLMKKAVQYFSNKFKLKVITIDKMLFSFTKADKQVRDAGPKEFIELFANAKFVITDSFHGTCFSVNFGKPFVSISPGKKSNRILSLLSLLNLENQLVSTQEEFEKIEETLEFQNAHLKLEELRKESLLFIKEAFM